MPDLWVSSDHRIYLILPVTLNYATTGLITFFSHEISLCIPLAPKPTLYVPILQGLARFPAFPWKYMTVSTPLWVSAASYFDSGTAALAGRWRRPELKWYLVGRMCQAPVLCGVFWKEKIWFSVGERRNRERMEWEFTDGHIVRSGNVKITNFVICWGRSGVKSVVTEQINRERKAEIITYERIQSSQGRSSWPRTDSWPSWGKLR